MKLGLEVIIAITLSIGMIMGYIMGVRVIARRVGLRLFRMKDDVLSKITETDFSEEFETGKEIHDYIEGLWNTAMDEEFKDKKEEEV